MQNPQEYPQQQLLQRKRVPIEGASIQLGARLHQLVGGLLVKESNEDDGDRGEEDVEEGGEPGVEGDLGGGEGEEEEEEEGWGDEDDILIERVLNHHP
jgi:hypothetical protein